MVLPFQKIYIISLQKSTNRRSTLFREFDRIGGVTDINGNAPVIFPANNGIKYGHQVDNSIKKQNRKNPISQGEIGCFASHRQVWSDFMESGLDNCMIMEDDIRFGQFAEKVFSNFDKFPDWDYVNFGYISNNKSIKNDLKSIKHESFPLLFSGCGMWLTHAYSINQLAAKIFYDFTQTQTGGIDWQLTGIQDQIKSFGFQGNHVVRQAVVTLCNPSLIKHTQ
jgi:GR25 family glycosyltransferase involved in LPS biosynthesis